MSGSTCLSRAVHGGLALFVLALVAAPAIAQPPVSQPPQMCGDGTTFTVQLPGTTLGIDDSDGLFKSINVPAVARPDSVTLPNGCRIYAVFISGYSNNRAYSDIPFFKVAEFVAKHNGYVHIGWWNNFTKEYTGGPLHPEDITIQPTILGIPVGEPETYGPRPAINGDLLAYAPLTSLVDRPKANPDDDYQFQSDAALVLKAIRAHNPDALIVVAGHSMGGNAVARLAMDRTVPIDLLAPIDPVGNRDKPRGIVGLPNFNWTRWRVAHQFRGYKQWDCVRGALNLCKDFDSRVFFFSYQCVPVGDWLDVAPVITTRAPVACPYVTPYMDPGARLGFGPNVKNLYHRWQHEFFWPVDFPMTERFTFHRPRSTATLWPNYQEPVLPQLNPFLPNEADKTCSAGTDPRDSSWQCEPSDGHGEIIGHRGPKGESRPALEMLGDWPRGNQYSLRRGKLVELATADASWPYRPENPNLCMVCDDMISIVQHLLATQPQPPSDEDELAPVSSAIADPGPGASGWNNEDVEVTISAVDEVSGSGVKDIEVSLSGAQAGTTVTAGDDAAVTVTAEGETTIRFFARDVAGNTETAQMLKVLIDKTPPTVNAAVGIEPNVNGWFKTPVVVSFPALDEVGGSGLASVTGDVAVANEGANQQVDGTATDYAGNTATASATLNIDLTVPSITIMTPPDGAAYLLNAKVSAAFNCSDNLSGVSACSGTVANGALLNTSSPGGASFTVDARDAADNVASATQHYLVRYAFSGFANPISAMPAVNATKAGATVPVKYSLRDANGPISAPTSFVSLTTVPVSCGSGAPLGTAAAAGAAGGTAIRAQNGGQFIFNWKTDSSWAGTCRALRLTLDDGSEHVAMFLFQ